MSGRSGGRLVSLDALRGLVMILMALDHSQFFVGKVHPLETWAGPLPAYQDPLAFLTRLAAHLCAPGFFFLMGVSMILFAQSRRVRGRPESEIVRHFMLRGLLLLVIQQFVANPAWLLGTKGSAAVLGTPGTGGTVWFNLDVLYGLGASMIVLAFFLRADKFLVALLSLGAILSTQVLMLLAGPAQATCSPLLRLLLIPGQTGILLVNYPLLPWVGVAGLGVAFGQWMAHDPRPALKWLPVTGLGSLALFVILRSTVAFGSMGAPAGPDWISFLNTVKYPPSLTFLLFTLGVNGLLLSLLSRSGPWTARQGPLVVFGRTALFFYVIHLYLYAFCGLAISWSASLAAVYGVWLAGLAALYPLCRWYGRFKAERAKSAIWGFL
jgi:uncharacterized membrane protein